MMRFLSPIILLLLIAQIASCNRKAETSHPRISEATNYNDCILQHMENISSDLAARAIDEACSNKFDTELPKPTNL